MSVKLDQPRIMRAKATPLTLEQAKSVAPAMFTKPEAVIRMNDYMPVETMDVVSPLLKLGYGIAEVAQSRSPTNYFDTHGKHMVRLRPLTNFVETKKIGEVVPEIIVVNAHDTSSALHLYMGLYRYVCSNGMVVGDIFDKQRFPHVKLDFAEVRRVVDRMAKELFPATQKQIMMLRQKDTTPKMRDQLATRAAVLRWGNIETVKPADLLGARREQDAANDLWHVFNRIQENLMYGGFTPSAASGGGNRAVTPVQRVVPMVKINRVLWDEAIRLAA